MRARAALLATAAIAAVFVGHPVALSREDRFAGIPRPVNAADLGQYPLDAVERRVEPARVRCPETDLVTYRGTHIRLDRATRVTSAFVNHVAAFEALVRDAAVAVYGRAPRQLRHGGTFHCREVRGVPGLLSEHGLGNAIDVRGFDFGPLPRGASAPNELPRALRRAFSVNIITHWRATRGVSALHGQFLARVEAELRAHPLMFRGMLGPAYPGHHDHLHLDMAPWSLIWM